VYNEFYGFKSLPFRLNPDPEFFFGSQGHKRALSYLRYGLSQREGFIVVTGMPGTGKTTLARELLTEIGRDKVIVGELNTTHLEADDVLRMAAASFGISHENVPKATLLNRLENFFLTKYRAGYHCLLLIDESQNLPVDSLEELRMLSNFYHGKHALLQIFLLGQQQFRDVLQRPDMEQLRQRVVAATHLEPMDKDETHNYILHRLRVAGWQERPVVTSRALDMVFLLTRGVPRRINTFCDRLFLYSALEELYEIDTDAVRTVGRELMLETEHPDRASQIDSLQTVSASQLEYARNELTSAIDSSMLETTDDRTPPPVGLRLVSGGNASASTMAMPRQDVVVVPFDETNPDIAIVAVLQALLDGQQPALEPMPVYMTVLLELALGKQSLAVFTKGLLTNEQREPLGDALRACFKQQLLEKSSDYYRRLAIDTSADAEKIKNHYRYMFRLFQVEQERDKQHWDSTYIRRINQAYATLRNDEGRAKYDAFLASVGKLPDSEMAGNATATPTAADAVPVVESVSTLRPATVGSPVMMSQLPPPPQEIIPEPVEQTPPPMASSGNKGGDWKKRVSAVGLVLLFAVVGGVSYFFESDWADSVKSDLARETSLEVAGLAPAGDAVGGSNATPIQRLPVEELDAANAAPAVADKLPENPDQKAAMVAEPAIPAPVEPKAEVEKPAKPVKEPKPAAAKESAAKPEKPVKPAKPEPQPVTVQEVEQLVDEFRAAYENGDLRSFISLFATEARTNDRRGVDQISADYRSLFESTSFRRFDLNDMRWNRSIGQVEGRGRFLVRVVRDDNSKLKTFEGDLQVSLRIQDGELKITRFDYSYK